MVSGDVPRWDRAQPALPYLFILLPAVFALLREWRPEAAGPGASAGLALVHGRRHASAGSTRPVAVIAYFVVLLAVIGALVRIDSVFLVTGIGAFILAFTLLPGWWAYAGVAATAGVLVVRARGRAPGRDALLVPRRDAGRLRGRAVDPDHLRTRTTSAR